MGLGDRVSEGDEVSLHSLYGIPIHVSDVAPESITVPVRKHKRRRGQSEAYHRRVQKKWTKRFGTKQERVMLFFNPAAVGLLGGPQLAINPGAFAMLRNFERTP